MLLQIRQNRADLAAPRMADPTNCLMSETAARHMPKAMQHFTTDSPGTVPVIRANGF